MTYRERAHTWQLRVAITERASAQSAQRKTSTIYLVHFLRSDLVLASALKVRGVVHAHVQQQTVVAERRCGRQAEYVEYLKHALCRALGCRSVTDRGLSARQVDALKELVLAPACTPDLVAAVMADDAAVTGRPHRRARDISSMTDADSRSDAVVDDSTLSRSFAKCSRHRAPGMSEASQKPAPLQHICIRVPNRFITVCPSFAPRQRRQPARACGGDEGGGSRCRVHALCGERAQIMQPERIR
jgi:hypothetical protein